MTIRRYSETAWLTSAISVSKSLRLRYGNIDIAVNANGVSGDYFNVYGMSLGGEHLHACR